MHLLPDLARLLLEFAALYVGATFLGDVVHYALHGFARSRMPLLRRLGALHEAHHRFLAQDLRIRREHAVANLLLHRVPEHATQAVATMLGFTVLPPGEPLVKRLEASGGQVTPLKYGRDHDVLRQARLSLRPGHVHGYRTPQLAEVPKVGSRRGQLAYLPASPYSHACQVALTD
jgi:hypothetical protein